MAAPCSAPLIAVVLEHGKVGIALRFVVLGGTSVPGGDRHARGDDEDIQGVR